MLVVFQLFNRRAWLRWALLFISARFAALAQPGWQPGFHPPGLNGNVAAVVVQANGDFIAGGEFTNAGGHPTADYVARWDGHRWRALGEGPGRFTRLSALRRYPNDHLLAAGVLLDSGAVRSIVTYWNGRRWQQLGPALSGITVTSLAVLSDGEVLAGYSGGRPTGSGYQYGVLRWDRSGWRPLGPRYDATATSSISQLVVPPAGGIVAAGYFGGEQYHASVACWTGSSWQPLGPPAQGYRTAEALALLPSGEVLAGGVLTDGRSYWSNYVARWDGHAWQPLGSGPAGKVERLVVSPTGIVLATTSTTNRYGTNRTTTIERWDGTRWLPLLPGPPRAGNTREAVAAAANGDVLVSDPIYGLTRWDGHRWHALAEQQPVGFATMSGTSNESVTALAAARRGNVLLATQLFRTDTTRPGRYYYHAQVYRWNGRHRRQLGPRFVGSITALAVAPNGDVLAAGPFVLAQGLDTIRYLARWTGRCWQPLGTPLPATVRALAVAPNGTVWAGGDFGLSHWDGHCWQPLPLPAPADSSYSQFRSPYVRALAVAPNGDVVAGGSFPSANPYYDAHVIRWDGRHWQLPEGGVEAFVNSVAVGRTGEIVVGSGATGHVHDFSSDWGSVVRSDTTDEDGWSYPPTRFNGYVNSVAVAANGDIIAGGSFSTVDAVSSSNLSRWHQGTWQAFPQYGLNGTVRAVVVAPNGDIVAGGDFTGTGDGTQSLGLWGIYRDR